MLAPICLFTFNRLEETIQTVEALQRNLLAEHSHLKVFSDGPRKEKDVQKVIEIRDFLKRITGFKSVQVFESAVNKGLANSIISGVSTVIAEYGKVIVLEDDLVTSPNFLNFMNQSLDFYESNNRIFSISGYTMDLPLLNDYSADFYYAYRASSWGWGTWKDRWEKVDWTASGYKSTLLNPISHLRFMRGGSDMPYMLWKQMNGKIDSWAIRWCYNQFINNQLTVYPTVSKLRNIGFGQEATHTKNTKRFFINFNESAVIDFKFDELVRLNKKLMSEYRQKFSILSRIKDRL